MQRWQRQLLVALGALWASWMTIPIMLFSWILVAIRQMNWVRFGTGEYTFEFAAIEGSLAHKWLFSKWAGLNLVGVIWYRNSYKDSEKTMKHEREGHAIQCYALNILQPVLYVITAAVIWIFIKERHAYVDNPFERHARAAAGQPVEVDYKEWYGDDRWPWW